MLQTTYAYIFLLILHYFIQIASHYSILFLVFVQEGWTPLHVAVQGRNRDIVKILLVNGADKTRRTKVNNLAEQTFKLSIQYEKNAEIKHDNLGSGWKNSTGYKFMLWEGFQIL